MLIKKVEFIKLLNLSKPGVRRSFNFVEPLHLANYQIHRTSEFIACEQAHIWGHTRERQRANIKWRSDSAEWSLVRRRE